MNYQVEIHKRGGGCQCKQFPSLSGASEFFAMHLNDRHDLVELKEWKSAEGAWACLEQWAHSDLRIQLAFRMREAAQDLYNACKVVLMTDRTVALLRDIDPKALKQIVAAVDKVEAI